jgi:hypothetical protein
MSGFRAFEVLASAPDMQKLAQERAADKLAAATNDERRQLVDADQYR